MKLLDRVRSVFRRKALPGELIEASFDQSAFQLSRMVQPNRAGEAALDKFRNVIFSLVGYNARAVASTALELFVEMRPANGRMPRARTRKVEPIRRKAIPLLSGTAVEQIQDHPALDLLMNANDQHNAFDLMERTQTNIELFGGAHWFIIKDKLGVPVEVWPLMSQFVAPVLDKKQMVRAWKYGQGRQAVEIPKDKIIYIPGPPDPSSMFLGMSRLKAAGLPEALNTAMMDWSLAKVLNNAVPDLLFNVEHEMDEEQTTSFVKRWEQKLKGPKNKGRTALLSGGKVGVTELGATHKDLQFLEGMKFTTEQLCNVFGVPAKFMLSTDTGFSSGVELEAAKRLHADLTVIPALTRIVEKMNEQLVPMFDPSGRLFFWFDDPVPESQADAVTRQKTQIDAGIFTPNEIRERDYGLPPREGGDAKPMPTMMAPPDEKRAKAEGDDLVIRPTGGERSDPKQPADKRPPKAESHRADAAEKDMARRVRREMTAQEAEVIEKINRNPLGGEDAWMFDKDEGNVRLAESLESPISEFMEEGAIDALDDIGLDISFTVTRPETQEFLKQYTVRLADGINSTTDKALRKTIGAGISGGENIAEITSRVAETMQIQRDFRAERIARSEVSRARNAGGLESYRQSGVVEKLVWRSSSDPCEFCASMDGRTVGINDGAFAADGAKIEGTDANGKPTGRALSLNYGDIAHPPLHPNCACTLNPVISDF